MNVMPIGSFQLDNLVRGQIPFYLVHFGVDFSSRYSGRELEFLSRISTDYNQLASEAEIFQDLENKKIPLHFPIVVICNDGVESFKFALKLDSKGFINTFYIKEGMKGLHNSN
jgi:rhodanese-related sulfurtransferase